MKALLDEGRKRRAKEDLDPEGKLSSKHQQPKPTARSVDEDDVRKLVEKVKRKKYL